MPNRSQQPKYDPTSEEIAAMCAEIRAGWSEDETMKRLVGFSNRAYEVPVVKTNNVGEIRTQRPEKRYYE